MFNEQAALVDNDADNKAGDADAALQELGSDLVSYGYVTTTITVSDPDRRAVDEHIRIAERIVNGRGFTAIRETLNAVDAWLGSLPGHPYANVRQPILHTLNLAHMVPLSAVWARRRDEPPLQLLQRSFRRRPMARRRSGSICTLAMLATRSSSARPARASRFFFRSLPCNGSATQTLRFSFSTRAAQPARQHFVWAARMSISEAPMLRVFSP